MSQIYLKKKLGIGDWGLGIGEWGFGDWPNPQSPIPIEYISTFKNKKIKVNYLY